MRKDDGFTVCIAGREIRVYTDGEFGDAVIVGIDCAVHSTCYLNYGVHCKNDNHWAWFVHDRPTTQNLNAWLTLLSSIESHVTPVECLHIAREYEIFPILDNEALLWLANCSQGDLP